MSASSKAKSAVTITWYTEPLNTTPAVKDMVAAFEKAYPSIHVKVVVGPSNVDTARAQLSTEISSGSATPDVYEGDVIWPAEFAKNNFAVNLSKHLPNSFWSRFAPGLLSEAKIHGSYYMAPWFMESGFLYYRKDLLAKAHLPVPKTWQQLEREAKTLQKDKLVQYGYVWQGADYEGLTCDWVEMMDDAGGNAVNGAYTKSTIDSAASLKALDFLRSTITSGISPSAVSTFQEPQALNLFDAGKAAFMRNWGYAWAITQTPSASSIAGKVGMVALPTFAGRSYPGASVVGGGNLYINPHSKYLSQDVTFLKWMTGTAAQSMLASIGKVLPVNANVQKSPAIRKLDEPLSVLPTLHLVSRPEDTPQYPALSQAIYRNLNLALTGAASPSTALKNAAQQIDSALSGSSI